MTKKRCIDKKIVVQPNPIYPIQDPYRYAQISIQQTIIEPKSDGERSALDEILNSGVESAEHRIELILGNLEAVQSTYLKNYASIHVDMMTANSLLGQIPVMRNYYFGREWSDLLKTKFGLREQIRRERTTRDKESSMLLKELRDTLIELKEEKSTNKMFNLEDAVDEDEGTNN